MQPCLGFSKGMVCVGSKCMEERHAQSGGKAPHKESAWLRHECQLRGMQCKGKEVKSTGLSSLIFQATVSQKGVCARNSIAHTYMMRPPPILSSSMPVCGEEKI